MRFFTLLTSLIMLTVLLANPSYAAGIPFITQADGFNLTLDPANKKLSKLLHEQLLAARQQANQQSGRLGHPIQVVKEEQALLQELLRSRGYYNAKIHYKLSASGEKNQPPHYLYTIETGPVYRIREILFDFPEGLTPPDLTTLSTRIGHPLIAEQVNETESKINQFARENYCLYEVRLKPQVTLSRNKAEAKILFTLSDSPVSKFGEVKFQGIRKIDPEYLRKQLPFKEGDCFRRHSLDQARLNFLQTNLISKASYQIALSDESSNTTTPHPVNIDFTLVEKPHHTRTVGLGYTTDGGFGLTLGYQHRNLFGKAELFKITLSNNSLNSALKGELTFPEFYQENQNLVLKGVMEDSETDAFLSKKMELSGTINRQLDKQRSAYLGVTLTQEEIEEDGANDTFNLLSFPFGYTIDSRDNLLNPTKGWSVSIGASPYFDIDQADYAFTQWSVSSSTYLTATDWPLSPTFAVRAATGALIGGSRQTLPADKRFYVGGGGSVRGYPYQTLGELTDNEADGGLSFGELALELRVKVAQSWGLTLFADGGYAYAERLPKFGEHFLWGAGIGVRYLTDFAPIRFDIAVPLEKREGVDDPFQIYISIGQAF